MLYLAVNFVCACALGAQGLAGTLTPASQVMRLALGEKGATLIAAGIGGETQSVAAGLQRLSAALNELEKESAANPTA